MLQLCLIVITSIKWYNKRVNEKLDFRSIQFGSTNPFWLNATPQNIITTIFATISATQKRSLYQFIPQSIKQFER